MTYFKNIKSKHHGVLITGLILVIISIFLILTYLKSSSVSEIEIVKTPDTQISKEPFQDANSKPISITSTFQTKNYNDYGLSFSIPPTWFESENTVTPNLFLTFKKNDEAEVGVSTSKKFTGHGVSGELVSKEKIAVSGLQGEIQIWEDSNKLRTITVNNLEKNGLFYTFEIFIYQNHEVCETEFREFLKSVNFR